MNKDNRLKSLKSLNWKQTEIIAFDNTFMYIFIFTLMVMPVVSHLH